MHHNDSVSSQEKEARVSVQSYSTVVFKLVDEEALYWYKPQEASAGELEAF